MRATKLVCTLGPASDLHIPELIDAGMDVARINLAHGARDDHDRLVRAVRAAAEDAGRPVGVMADLAGPKVRLGEIEGGEVRLREGTTFALRPGGGGDATGAATSYPGLAGDLEEGDRVLLSDGIVELRVAEVSGDEVRTEVVRGGLIRSRAGVNVPAERLGLPALTEKDVDDLGWVREAGVDLVAQSFVRGVRDVEELCDLVREDPALVVAKIETGSAVAEVDGIMRSADVVMVARGDLGVELPPHRIPVIQKDLVARANRAGLPVIVATQMLESMTKSPRPTRAEASDVAGAVFEGASGILLSAETAIGEHPIEVAAMAARILETAETEGRDFITATPEEGLEESAPHAIAHAAAAAVRDAGARAVACFTRSGRTARLLSGVRLGVPIHAFSHVPEVVRRLTIFRGVHPTPCELPRDTDAMLDLMDRELRAGSLAGPGDTVVLVASTPVGEAKTNLLKVHRIS